MQLWDGKTSLHQQDCHRESGTQRSRGPAHGSGMYNGLSSPNLVFSGDFPAAADTGDIIRGADKLRALQQFKVCTELDLTPLGPCCHSCEVDPS